MNCMSWHVRIPRVRLTAIILCLIALFAEPAPAAHAATITVNDTDGGTGGPGCKLRDAITAANTNTATGGCTAGDSGADIIELPNGVIITLTVVDNGGGTVEATGLPLIITDITINGNNSTIQRSSAGGTPNFRILKINSLGNLVLDNVTLSNGRSADGGGSSAGMGGAISNFNILTLNNSTVNGNRTGDGSTGGLGGGIASTYIMTITNSTISDNTTGVGSTSEGGDGGGIYNSGTLTILNSTIDGNTIGTGHGGGFGGGIFNLNNTTINLTDSTISNNTAGNGTLGGGSGGGIYNGTNVTANITNCAISGNTAGSGGTVDGGYGGGIYQGSGTLTITNATISGNTTGNSVSSSAGHGGAIYAGGGTANLANVTISGNSTGTGVANGSGGGIRSEGTLNVTSSTIASNTATWTGGGVFVNAGTATLKNTIVANNTGSPNANCAGATVTNGGNNLDSGTTCGWGAASGSLSNTNPLLGSLASNGGARQTMALQIGSPAIDGVTFSAPNSSPATDERGATRPQGARHDIGAYEAVIITVNTNSGGTGGLFCTLRDAITAANTDISVGSCLAGFGPDIIVLPTSATITLAVVDNGSGINTNGLPLVTSDVAISGNNSIIERSSAGGTPAFRIFSVDTTGVLSLNNVTVRNGRTPDATLPGMPGGFGGGISSFGILNINNSTISGNRTGVGNGNSGGSGGGIYLGMGTANIASSTFSGNTTGNGISGGSGAGISALGVLTLTDCTLTGNSTGTPNGVGGGLNIGSDMAATVTSSTIASNTATLSGGGIRTGGATTTLRNTIVANNTAPSNANCDNAVTNGGNNLDSGGSCNWTTDNGSMSSTNPLLGALANNGGPTQTMGLLVGSPAIDGVTWSPPNTSPTTDQRGVARPQRVRHDIGAFEATPPLYLPLIRR